MKHATFLTLMQSHSLSKAVTLQVLNDVYLANLEVARDARLQIDNESATPIQDRANMISKGLGALGRCEAILELGVISGLLSRAAYDKRIRYDVQELGTYLISS